MPAAPDHPFSYLRVDPEGWLGPTVVSGEGQILQGRLGISPSAWSHQADEEARRLMGMKTDGSFVCAPQDRHIELRKFAKDLGLHLYPDEIRRVIQEARAVLAGSVQSSHRAWKSTPLKRPGSDRAC